MLCIWLLLLAAGTLVAAAAVAVVAVSSCLSATPPFVARHPRSLTRSAEVQRRRAQNGAGLLLKQRLALRTGHSEDLGERVSCLLGTSFCAQDSQPAGGNDSNQCAQARESEQTGLVISRTLARTGFGACDFLRSDELSIVCGVLRKGRCMICAALVFRYLNKSSEGSDFCKCLE